MNHNPTNTNRPQEAAEVNNDELSQQWRGLKRDLVDRYGVAHAAEILVALLHLVAVTGGRPHDVTRVGRELLAAHPE